MGILRFSVGGFPVQVMPGFWALLGLLAMWWRVDIAQGVLVAAVAFLSVLVHELGHAFAGRAFGLKASITLHMMGGATLFMPGTQLSRGRDILVSAAGPFAGLALGVGSLLAYLARTPNGDVVAPEGGLMLALFVSAQINIIWSVLNLVPVVPFDGGRILVAALGPRRRPLAAALSLASGIGAGLLLYQLQLPIAAILIASSAVSSFVRMRQSAATPRASVSPQAVEGALAEATRALLTAPAKAAALAQAVLQSASEPAHLRRAAELLAWARLGQGDAPGAQQVLGNLGIRAFDPYLVGSVQEAMGELEQAHATLIGARQRGDERVELQALLAKVLLGLKRYRPAAAVTRELVGHVPLADVKRVAAEVRDGAGGEAAAELLLAIAAHTRTAEDVLEAARARAGTPHAASPVLELASDIDAGLEQQVRALMAAPVAPSTAEVVKPLSAEQDNGEEQEPHGQ